MSEPWIIGRGSHSPATSRVGEWDPDGTGMPPDILPGATGTAMGGAVKVRWDGSQVADVHIAPPALRRPSSDLCAAIRDATNTAIAASLQQAREQAQDLAEQSTALMQSAVDEYRSRLAEIDQMSRTNVEALQHISDLHFGRHY